MNNLENIRVTLVKTTNKISVLLGLLLFVSSIGWLAWNIVSFWKPAVAVVAFLACIFAIENSKHRPRLYTLFRWIFSAIIGAFSAAVTTMLWIGIANALNEHDYVLFTIICFVGIALANSFVRFLLTEGRNHDE